MNHHKESYQNYTPEQTEEMRKRCREYYHAHKEERKAYALQYNKRKYELMGKVYIQRSVENLRKFILDYKKDKKCELCGYNKNTSILQFHHVKEKEYNISSKTKTHKAVKSKVKFLEEIKKCILICPNCHMEIHSSKK